MRANSLSTSERDAGARAVEAVWCAAWGALGADPATLVDDTPEYLRVRTPSSSDLLLNAVLRFRQQRAVTVGDVARVVAPFRAAGRPWQWWLRLGAEPVGLRDRLVEQGMQCWGTPTGMALRLAGWRAPFTPNAAITARPVADAREVDAALGIICAVFGMTDAPMRRWGPENPQFVAYVAWMDGEPVGALVRQISAGLAGIFHVATLQPYRRHGVAAALLTQALCDARNVGAHTAALTATPMAERLYHRLGFAPCCVFELWMPGPRLLTALHGV